MELSGSESWRSVCSGDGCEPDRLSRHMAWRAATSRAKPYFATVTPFYVLAPVNNIHNGPCTRAGSNSGTYTNVTGKRRDPAARSSYRRRKQRTDGHQNTGFRPRNHSRRCRRRRRQWRRRRQPPTARRGGASIQPLLARALVNNMPISLCTIHEYAPFISHLITPRGPFTANKTRTPHIFHNSTPTPAPKESDKQILPPIDNYHVTLIRGIKFLRNVLTRFEIAEGGAGLIYKPPSGVGKLIWSIR